MTIEVRCKNCIKRAVSSVGRARSAHERGRRFESSHRPPIFFHDIVGSRPGETQYLERWVIQCRWFSIRLHHWFGDDDQRHPHDHAWWFISFVLSGVVREKLPCGSQITRRAFSVRFFPAHHSHMVSANAWTLLLTGPATRKWGFFVDGEWMNKKTYFQVKGHH